MFSLFKLPIKTLDFNNLSTGKLKLIRINKLNIEIIRQLIFIIPPLLFKLGYCTRVTKQNYNQRNNLFLPALEK